jgi:hypothetical protein
MDNLDLGIGLQEVWKIPLKIRLSFPSRFFFGVMIP